MKIDFFKEFTNAVNDSHRRVNIANWTIILYYIATIVYIVWLPELWFIFMSLLALVFISNRERNIAIIKMAGIVTALTNFIYIMNEGINKQVIKKSKSEEE